MRCTNLLRRGRRNVAESPPGTGGSDARGGTRARSFVWRRRGSCLKGITRRRVGHRWRRPRCQMPHPEDSLGRAAPPAEERAGKEVRDQTPTRGKHGIAQCAFSPRIMGGACVAGDATPSKRGQGPQEEEARRTLAALKEDKEPTAATHSQSDNCSRRRRRRGRSERMLRNAKTKSSVKNWRGSEQQVATGPRLSTTDDKTIDQEDEHDGDDMDVSTNSFSAWTEEERQKRLEVARAGLAYYVNKFGEEAEETEEVRDEISCLERASRDAKPFKTHRGLLERKRERLRAKQDKDESEVARIRTEQEELRTKLESLQAAMAERKKTLTQVEEELADLVKRALAEGDAAGPAGQQGDDASAPWSPQAASSILMSLASKPGVPPEFATLLGHVYQAAQALAAAGAAAGQAAAQPLAGGGSSQQSNQARGARSSQKTETGAASSEGGGLLAKGQPNQLAPQGRWSKPGATAATGTTTTSTGADGGEDTRQAVGASEGATGAGGAAAVAGGAGEATAAAPQTGRPSGSDKKSEGAATTGQDDGDQDPELIDAEMGDAELDGEVAASISKLPTADQARLRAALGARGGRRRRDGNDDGERDSGNRDRERSPRPTKVGGAEDEA